MAASANPSNEDAPPGGRRVVLFATCLVDLFRPSVGFAAVRLLENAGCTVSAPLATCCGQPAYNAGDRVTARRLARAVIAAFAGAEYVVVPSGSCAAMLKVHYPALFVDDAEMREKAATLAGRVHELASFLSDVLEIGAVEAGYDGTATYHDGCSGLRELGVQRQPRALLNNVRGLRLMELPGAEECCGFGGTFCVKYPDISLRMVSVKTAAIMATGADTLLAGDLGCLLNIAGRLRRQGAEVRVRHFAEVLAGMTGSPPIGAPAKN